MGTINFAGPFRELEEDIGVANVLPDVGVDGGTFALLGVDMPLGVPGRFGALNPVWAAIIVLLTPVSFFYE